MKRKGYALVGAEQTANSKDIVSFSFQPSTVLVLGYVSSFTEGSKHCKVLEEVEHDISHDLGMQFRVIWGVAFLVIRVQPAMTLEEWILVLHDILLCYR